MEKLRQNAFWAGLGVAGAILAAGVGILVVPLWGDRDTLQKKTVSTLRVLSGDVPGKPDIESWNVLRDQMKKDYRTVTDFYASCDSKLESWFQDLPANPVPGRDAFMTRYRDMKQDIEKKLTEKGTKIGVGSDDDPSKAKFGFNWEEPNLDDWGRIAAEGARGDEGRVLSDLQKRFWARQRVANVVLNGDVNVSRIRDFHFFRRLHEKLQTPPWEVRPAGAEAVKYAGFPEEKSFTRSTFAEISLPDQLGKTLSFGFAVDLPYREVPRFLKEFLNPAADQNPRERLLANILGCRVTILQQNPAEIPYKHVKGDREDQAANEKEAKKKVTANDVMLVVTAQIIDFEPSSVKKTFEAQAGAP